MVPYLFILLTVFGGELVLAQELAFGLEDDDHAVNNDAQAAIFLCSSAGWCGDSEAQSVITKERLTKMLTAFQIRFELPVTGELNVETKALMSSPRCGYPDYGPAGFDGDDGSRKKRFTLTGTTWPRNRPITWFIENSSDDVISDSVVESEIMSAFRRWDEASGITLMKATNPNSADIRLSFQRGSHGDGNTFDGAGGTLAHAFGPGFGFGGDVHFDDDETFVSGRGFNIHQIATHEIGHSLGLGHSTINSAVMAPFYNYQTSFNLHPDDVQGIQSLYGTAPVVPPRMTLPPIPPVMTTTTTEAPPPPPPVYCNINIDAVANSFDGGLYVFEGARIYKVHIVDGVMSVDEGYPRLIWIEFPQLYIANVDAAVLFRYSNGYNILYIFKDDLYWRIDNGELVPNYPRSISGNWGGIPPKVDAAFFWTGNSYLYFIKGNTYYRYSFTRRGVDFGYPRPLTVWNNVQSPVASAVDFQGITYFFQDRLYQQFSDRSFTAGNQLPTAQRWFGCEVQELKNDAPTEANEVDEDITELTCGTSSIINNSLILLIAMTAVHILRHF